MKLANSWRLWQGVRNRLQQAVPRTPKDVCERRVASSPFALLMFVLAALGGCTRTFETRSESSSSAVQQEQASQKERVVETRTEGPEVVTTTVEEYEQPAVEGSSLRGSGPASEPQSGGVSPAVPHTGNPILVKRTVTVDQRGPVVDTRSAVETSSLKAISEVHTASQTASKEKTSYWPPWPVWLAGAASLALGYAALRGYLKIASL